MKSKVLVLGINGLIGSTLFRCLSNVQEIDVYGTYNKDRVSYFFKKDLINKKIFKCDAINFDDLLKLIIKVEPDFVINCIGITKHHLNVNDKTCFLLNAELPKYLADQSNSLSYKLIHISTDCIYSGKKGMYKESDPSDAIDSYGKSKAEGEKLKLNSLILRTSTIGHEHYTNYGLLNWFLNQDKSCVGFQKAIFSGIPTITLSNIIKSIIINSSNLSGIYNISANPINKYLLLKIIAKIYKKNIVIVPDNSFIIDRSLDNRKFCKFHGKKLPDWEFLIKSMYDDNQKYNI